MIVVVEGISAAGKTSWCARHAEGYTVPEAPPAPDAPSRTATPEAAARYWADHSTQRNAERWRAALALEAREGLAVCDTDPFQLHYAWSRWWIGEGDRDAFWREAETARALFASGDLGLADLVLVAGTTPEATRRQRDADPTRSRRNFELHVRLLDPLRRWYAAVDRLDPGRVRWSLPDTPAHEVVAGLVPRVLRSNVLDFDVLLLDLERAPMVSGQ